MPQLKHSLFGAAVIAISLSTVAHGAVVATVETDIAPDGGTGLYTPSFTAGGPSSDDILEGVLPTTTTGSFTLENSTGVSALTNGTVETAYGTGAANSLHVAYATGGNTGGTSITYALGGVFDLDSIVVFGGWNDAGRDAQRYDIYTSDDAGSTFDFLTSFDNSPGEEQGVVVNPITHRVAFTETSAANLATGVTNLRFDFLEVENGYVGYAEIDVFGSQQFLPGDADRNGVVDLDDFNLISDNFFTTPSAPGLDGDIVVDNFVDVKDFRLWKNSADAALVAVAEASFAVPEPASFALLGVGLAFVACARRRRR